MRSAWPYGAIHGEAAPDFGTTLPRRSPTAARRCSRPPLSASAPRVRHQSGISTFGELAAPACGKARARAAARPLSPDRPPRAASCGLATPRPLRATHSRIGTSALERRMTPPIDEIKGHNMDTQDTRENPSNAARKRRGAILMMRVQQLGKSEPRETAAMCAYNPRQRAGSPLYDLLAMR